MTTTTATRPSTSTSTNQMRWAGTALAASFALLYTELFLTADAEAPNTWVGMISDSIVLSVAGGLAMTLVAVSRSASRAKAAGVTCFVLTLLFSLPFWTASALVLGTTAYVLNVDERRPLALIGALLAFLSGAFLLVEMVVSFAPGLPS